MSDLQPPTNASAAGATRRLLLILAATLAAFVACAGLALAVFVLATPAIHSQLPFLASAPGAPATPAAGPPPEAPRKFSDPPAGPVQIVDDFSVASERWDRSQTRIADGAYELRLDLANFDSYGLFLGEGDIRDFDLAVDAVQIAGPTEGEFGIRFRQRAPDDHLMFSISASGYYRLLRVRERTYTSLVPWTRHEGIQAGSGQTNRLRLVADGAQISGFINGVEVLSYEDREPQAGQLTLGLVTFDQGDLVVRFDNLAGFAQVGPRNADQERIILDEDFSNPATARWSVSGTTLRNRAYEIFVGGSVISWQQPLPIGASAVGDHFVLEVEATLLEGVSDGTGYGLMFADDGEFDFMALMILPQGGMFLFRNGPEGGLIVPPIPVPAVNPGLNQRNRLRLEASGQQLTITINDETLPTLDLPPDLRLHGRSGLIVQSADPQGVRVRFDNFRLEEQARPVVMR
jgi:hypothetical protein